MMIENPFRTAVFFGLAMIGVALALLFINPLNQQNLPEGFQTPIIAFEFMNNVNDVFIFFQVDDPKEYAARMMLGNKIDYLFMILYPLFLCFVGIGFYRITGLRFILLVAILLPLIISLSDALENLNIAAIIKNYKTTSIDQELRSLNVFTWIKWSGIASLLLIYASLIFKRPGWYKSVGVVGVLTFIACVISFFMRGVYLEVMATLVMVSFVVLFVAAWKGFGYLG